MKVDRIRLRALMEMEPKSSLRDVADAAGWSSRSMVQRLLSGELRTVTPARAELIAEYFNVTTDFLFERRVTRETAHADQSKKVPA